MIGCLRTRVLIAIYFESENELKFYNLEARLEYFTKAYEDHEFGKLISLKSVLSDNT